MIKNRVFVLGLDGATWKILDPLIQQGKMPFLKRLKDQGASGVLESAIPSLTPVVWTTMRTGLNPGKHSIFGFVNYSVDMLDPPIYNSGDIKGEKLEEILSRYGKKSLIINLPLTYPITPISGILISSFLTPKGGDYVYPRKLKKELDNWGYAIDYNQFAEDKKLGLPREITNNNEKELFHRIVRTIVDKRIDAYKKLIARDEYDLVFLLIKSTDVMQHVYYNGKEVVKFYEWLDKKIKYIYDIYEKFCPGERYFFLLSDHGFHRTPDIQFSPYVWLSGTNKKDQVGVSFKGVLWKLLKGTNKFLKKIGINTGRYEVVANIRNKVVEDVEAKALENFINNFRIRPVFDGLYFQDEVDEEKLESLVKSLRRLEFKKNKVFNFVKAKEKFYKGNNLDGAPDIVWMLNEGFIINGSPIAKELFRPLDKPLKGDHISDRQGIFIFNGRSFKKTENSRIIMEDVLPLICALLNIPVPQTVDGSVPQKLMKSRVKALSEREFVADKVDSELINIVK